MPENYAEGYPLRKDFPLRGRFSRAEQTRRALSMDVEDHYTAEELDIGGEVSGTADADRRTQEKADRADEKQYEGDPALGDIAYPLRKPVPGGEATTGASE
jgi:NADH-quinone oxidoreductase subunit C